MVIIKFFYEEPAHMEALVDFPEDALGTRPVPREAHRLFISATDMTSGRNGSTAIEKPSVWIDPLLETLLELSWMTSDGTTASTIDRDMARALLEDPGDQSIVVGAATESSPELVNAAARLERRAGMANLISLLKEGAQVIFLREPAYHGFDWTVYSADLLTARFRESWMVQRPHEEIRAFTLPWNRARGEHRFHFEHWALDDPQDWMEEIV